MNFCPSLIYDGDLVAGIVEEADEGDGARTFAAQEMLLAKLNFGSFTDLFSNDRQLYRI